MTSYLVSVYVTGEKWIYTDRDEALCKWAQMLMTVDTVDHLPILQLLAAGELHKAYNEYLNWMEQWSSKPEVSVCSFNSAAPSRAKVMAQAQLLVARMHRKRV